MTMEKRILFATNTSRHAWRHRSTLALAALNAGHKVCFLCPSGEEVASMKAVGIEHIPLSIQRKGINPFRELITLFSVYKSIKRFKPDIYHGFTIKLLIYGGISCRLQKVPKYFLNVTGIGSLFLDSNSYNFTKKIVSHLYKWVFTPSQARAIFQNSEDKKFFINQKWIKKEKCIVISGTGIDTRKIVPSYSTRNEKVNILYAGRIIKDKGISELISACENIQKNQDCLRLHICGELDSENPSNYSQHEWETISKKEFIRLHGFQSQMKKHFEKADIVCLPSYREGLPLFLIEAGAYGKVAVASDVPGCNTIITNNENGLLVEVKNIVALQEALELLIQNPDIRFKMGKKARLNVENNYDSHLLINKYLQLYLN
ncbi:MAG: glycosyltransferase family 4 protein [Bdellovibrionales bacterium]|nr:glycosyltransferase family 4 protein [Bdellovibrionales bacterium]